MNLTKNVFRSDRKLSGYKSDPATTSYAHRNAFNAGPSTSSTSDEGGHHSRSRDHRGRGRSKRRRKNTAQSEPISTTSTTSTQSSSTSTTTYLTRDQLNKKYRYTDLWLIWSPDFVTKTLLTFWPSPKLSINDSFLIDHFQVLECSRVVSKWS